MDVKYMSSTPNVCIYVLGLRISLNLECRKSPFQTDSILQRLILCSACEYIEIGKKSIEDFDSKLLSHTHICVRFGVILSFTQDG